MTKTNYLKQINIAIKEKRLSCVKGGYMEEFETEAARMFGNKFGVSTCNGTSALYLALFCLSSENNKREVIIPAYGFHVSVSVICAFGLKPVFCDVDLKTYALDFNRCEELINNNTLAVMVLQPWGNLADLDKMTQLKKKYDVFWISDSSHAHEAKWDRKAFGRYFDINCASFGLGKPISGGELGVLTTDNPVFRDRALLFSHTNRVPGDLITDTYKHISNSVGIKFRPHLFATLIALDDLKNNKNQRVVLRSKILKFQKRISAQTKWIKFQENYKKAKRVFYMPVIGFDKEIDTKKLIADLNKQGFHARKHEYQISLSKNSITADFYRVKVKKEFPNTNLLLRKNIIQLYSTDFINNKKVSKLEKILLKYVN